MKQRFIFSILIFSFPFLSSQAQEPSGSAKKVIKIKDVDFGTVKTPRYTVKISDTSKGSSGNLYNWLEMRCNYATGPEWLDEITFTYYVLLKAKSKKDLPKEATSPYTFFSGTVTYTNVEKGKRHTSTMYLHPSVFERYGEVSQLTVLVNYNGAVVSSASKPKAKQRWWEKFVPKEGFVLQRNQTPFWFYETEKYEAIKQ